MVTQLGSILKGTIETLAFGGHGVMRHGELVIFIPFTRPGDEVQVIITQRKKRFAKGELIKVIQQAESAPEPRCAHYGVCGGCQFQHLSYERQMEAKRRFVLDALERIGKIREIPPLHLAPAKLQWEYRRHITLQVTQENQRFGAGYSTLANEPLSPVRQCPIFIEESSSIFEEIDTWLRTLPTRPGNHGRLSLYKRGKGEWVIALKLKRTPDDIEERLKEAQQRFPHWKGLLFQSDGKTPLIQGDIHLRISLGDLTLQANPQVFIQNHPEESQRLYLDLVAHVQTVKPSRILDLYCGFGSTTLLLASRMEASITGVEWNEEAIRLARLNSANNGLSQVDFRAGAAEEIGASLIREIKPELVVLNPPREGLHPHLLDQLCLSGARHIAYLSCQPATLARDLNGLQDAGYRLRALSGYDQFPQTTHIETLAWLEKSP